MNLLQMRTILRRRLQDPLVTPNGDTIDNPQWTDAELTELINLALLEVQEMVLDLDPGAFISVDTFDIVANQERYDKPPGFLYEYQLSIADNSGQYATGWRPLFRETYKGTRLRLASNVVEYSSLGRWFHLSPIPTVSQDDALQLVWCYSLSLTDDADVPLIVLPLHNCIVDMALIVALSETAEMEAQDRAQKRVDRKLAKLPTYYRRSRGEPPSIQPALRGAALSRRNRLPRDVYRTNG